MAFSLSCWRLTTVDAPHISSTLVWSRPASRCFPTCSDATHTLADSERRASALAQRVMGHEWTWAGIGGLRFTFSEEGGGGVLITPWGHGTWGITPSRSDVLVAEFAQKRHMLKFEDARLAFVSTRCDDGELVRGTGR